ncbi:argininosuccinate lyase [Taibaiella chishuiensis]|uniref:Argininosuccinate lyase n=1 Tax=Taibaiella chishuiensis TaxID=1434707 RepID=A0A2P8DAK2_9BACT|nr:argininosuccinate lyase [Taibaiella chishuiensis]PSK94256.1 argininosuccinate lyase [Taibaiella chishuiensis]
MKLWQKDNTDIAQRVEAFTVGRDRDFDLLLAACDVKGSLAHTEMLCKAGLLTPAEKEQVHHELHALLEEIAAGRFRIEDYVEDVHSQVELMLTRKIGDAGKKIHSGRSRNDQVAVDLKLFLKQSIQELSQAVKGLFDKLIALSEKHKTKLLPGYTHLQIAMPSSFGLWFGAYAESLVDDLELLAAAYAVTDKNPLGSGAGYGSSFPLDRTLTTSLLGFAALHHNAVYAQMSRGKTEKFVATGIAAVAATLARLSMDVCLFLSQNFGFISFPAALTTGSSIMPHKKNPDIFELVRGKCNRLQSAPNELALLLTNLPSGYHRELQLTKEIIFPALETLQDCIGILDFALPQIEVQEHILADKKYQYLFTVEAVNDLVHNGVPFREAYQVVGNAVEAGSFSYDHFDITRHTHEGSMGNLCNEAITGAMERVMKRFA